MSTNVLTKLDKKKENRYNKVISFLHKTHNYRYNTIKNRIENRAKGTSESGWEVANEVELKGDLSTQAGIEVSKDTLGDMIAYSKCSVHMNPLRDYFSRLQDRETSGNIDSIAMYAAFVKLADLSGSAHDFFVQMVRKWAVSSVKCVMEDGHFNKRCLVIQGSQDTYKTSYARFLVPSALKGYCVENPNLAGGDKDARIAIARNLIIILDELDKYSSTNQAHIKHYITMSEVNERLPYARVESQFPRVASFIGTTNKKDFLRDETGSKRFMTFSIGDQVINPAYRKFDIDDFWSEAVRLYKSGFDCELTRKELVGVELLNEEFKQNTSEYELLRAHFLPSEKAEEDAEFLTSTSILRNLAEVVGPAIKLNAVTLGRALNREGTGFEKVKRRDGKNNIYGYWVKRNMYTSSTTSHLQVVN